MKNKRKKQITNEKAGSPRQSREVWLHSEWDQSGKLPQILHQTVPKMSQKTWNFKFTFCCMNLYKRPRPSYQELVAKLIFLLDYRSKLNQCSLLHFVKNEHAVSWNLKSLKIKPIVELQSRLAPISGKVGVSLPDANSSSSKS